MKTKESKETIYDFLCTKSQLIRRIEMLEYNAENQALIARIYNQVPRKQPI